MQPYLVKFVILYTHENSAKNRNVSDVLETQY
jgi:hypothetical protein